MERSFLVYQKNKCGEINIWLLSSSFIIWRQRFQGVNELWLWSWTCPMRMIGLSGLSFNVTWSRWVSLQQCLIWLCVVCLPWVSLFSSMANYNDNSDLLGGWDRVVLYHLIFSSCVGGAFRYGSVGRGFFIFSWDLFHHW